jgi:hypothetical protein
MKDFFVSYTGTDQSWAEWVAWHLEASGYSVVIQAWDFRPGHNFIVEMHKAATSATRTIIILSSDYLAARFTVPEWTAAFAEDPTGELGKLVPVRVGECTPKGLLPQVVYIDLVGKSEKDARAALLSGISHTRAKPSTAPAFPAGATHTAQANEPHFPSSEGFEMPCLREHIELFRRDDILEALPGLTDGLLQTLRPASTSSILLDTTVIKYGFEALSEYPRCVSRILPSKKWIVLNCVAELINALVLHETVMAGPVGGETWYARDDLSAAMSLIQRPEHVLDDQILFGLLSLSRTRAMDALRANPSLIDPLAHFLPRRVDPDLVRRYIGTMSVNASHQSPHHWERLFADGPTKYYAYDLSVGVLGTNMIALNAIDADNANKYQGNDDYFEYTAKRGGLEFPSEDSIHEFYAASLLFRTVVYLYLSELLGCTYRGDLMRATLAKAILASQPRSRRSFGDVVVAALGAEEEARDDVVNQLLGTEVFRVAIPLVAQAVLSRAKSVADVLKITLEMRNSVEAQRFRAFSHSVDEAIAKGDRREVEAAIRQLQAFGVDLRRATGAVDTDQRAQEIVIHGSTLLTNIVEAAKRPVRGLLERIRYRHLAFLDTLRSAPRSFGVLDRLLA